MHEAANNQAYGFGVVMNKRTSVSCSIVDPERFTYDLKAMEEALAAPSKRMPKVQSIEEFEAWIDD